MKYRHRLSAIALLVGSHGYAGKPLLMFPRKIEREFLTFRTRIKRLARRTICFSKSERMHDLVIGLFINRFESGRNV